MDAVPQGVGRDPPQIAGLRFLVAAVEIGDPLVKPAHPRQAQTNEVIRPDSWGVGMSRFSDLDGSACQRISLLALVVEGGETSEADVSVGEVGARTQGFEGGSGAFVLGRRGL